MFLDLLTSNDNEQLLLDVQRQISQNNINVRAREDAMNRCLEQTSRIFTEDLRHVMWEPIAAQKGLLPAPNASDEASHFEYLDEPWVWDEATAFLLVKGSNHIFLPRPDGGPSTKFEALFDGRPAFNGLRFSFLTLICGAGFEHLEDFMTQSNVELSPEAWQRLTGFLELASPALNNAVGIGEAPPNFAARSWPLAWDCMTDESGA